MIRTSRQLKKRIRNLAPWNSPEAQLIMREYMTSRLLERISRSPYRDKVILKGDMLVSALVGFGARSTMDLDAAVKGMDLHADSAKKMLSDIMAVDVGDKVVFQLESISEIPEEAEYPGVLVSLTAHFDGTSTPLQADITTGDIITPREVRCPLNLMWEDHSIELWAYNIETILAEKLETILSRATANTRMRDFHDIVFLTELYADEINPGDLHDALIATARRRGTENHLDQAREIFEEVENSPVMQNLWDSYCQNFSYDLDLKWSTVMEAVSRLYSTCEKGTASV